MKITLLLFAAVRKHLGTSTLIIEIENPATVGDLRQRLGTDYPPIEALTRRSLFAVGTDYVGPDHPLEEGQVLAWIPPVSGG